MVIDIQLKKQTRTRRPDLICQPTKLHGNVWSALMSTNRISFRVRSVAVYRTSAVSQKLAETTGVCRWRTARKIDPSSMIYGERNTGGKNRIRSVNCSLASIGISVSNTKSPNPTGGSVRSVNWRMRRHSVRRVSIRARWVTNGDVRTARVWTNTSTSSAICANYRTGMWDGVANVWRRKYRPIGNCVTIVFLFFPVGNVANRIVAMSMRVSTASVVSVAFIEDIMRATPFDWRGAIYASVRIVRIYILITVM